MALFLEYRIKFHLPARRALTFKFEKRFHVDHRLRRGELRNCFSVFFLAKTLYGYIDLAFYLHGSYRSCEGFLSFQQSPTRRIDPLERQNKRGFLPLLCPIYFFLSFIILHQSIMIRLQFGITGHRSQSRAPFAAKLLKNKSPRINLSIKH